MSRGASSSTEAPSDPAWNYKSKMVPILATYSVVAILVHIMIGFYAARYFQLDMRMVAFSFNVMGFLLLIHVWWVELSNPLARTPSARVYVDPLHIISRNRRHAVYLHVGVHFLVLLWCVFILYRENPPVWLLRLLRDILPRRMQLRQDVRFRPPQVRLSGG